VSDIVLSGLRAENPMAFLAALGALSLAADGANGSVALSWQEDSDGSWTPTLQSNELKTAEQTVEAILAGHNKRDLKQELGWDKDLMRVSRESFRDMLACRFNDEGDAAEEHRPARMLAACLCELPARRDPQLVPYTPFRLIPRVGRAQFLHVVQRESEAGINHLHTCLFEQWQYKRGTQALRWDPGAEVPARAVMAQAPTHLGPSGVPGSVLLAARGLTFFPLITTRGGRAGFATPAGMTLRDRFIWPIWDQPLSESATRMMVSMPWLHRLCKLRDEEREKRHPTDWHEARKIEDERRYIFRQLKAHAVTACYVAQRVRRGDDNEALGWGEPIVVPG
jgi:hypothetical protein